MSTPDARLVNDVLDYLFRWKSARYGASHRDAFLSQLRSRVFRLQHARSIFQCDEEQDRVILHALERLISSKSRFRDRTSGSFSKLESIQILQQEHVQAPRSSERTSPVRLTRCRTKQMLALAVLSEAASPTSHVSDVATTLDFASSGRTVSQRVNTLSAVHAGVMYTALVKQWRCICDTCGEAYISLGHERVDPISNARDTNFDMIFSTGSAFNKILQEGRLTVEHNPPAKTTEIDDMCTFIRNSAREHCQFRIRLSPHGISQMGPSAKDFDTSQSPQSIPLASLFNMHGLPTHRDPILPLRGRRILAAVIAKALGPLLATPWLDDGQMLARIHFFRPMRRGKSPSITQPFLTIDNLNPNSLTKNPERPSVLHPVPGVLALGIMLCELHYCTPITFWTQPKHLCNGDPTPNTPHNTAWDVWEMMQRAVEHVGVQYAKAIENCLNWNGELTNFTTVAVQNEFHAKVVRPLENEAGHYAGIPMEKLNSLTQEVERQLWGEQGLRVLEATTRQGSAGGGSSHNSSVSVDLFHQSQPNPPHQMTEFDGLNRGSHIGFNQGPIVNNIYYGGRAGV